MASLAVREHRRVLEMRMGVERAESEARGVVKEFAPGSVARSPTYGEGIFRGQAERTLHGNGDGSAGGEDGGAFTTLAGGEKLREAGIYAEGEGAPGLHAGRCDFFADPHGDDGFEEFLKGGALRELVRGGLEGRVEGRDGLVGGEEIG